MAFFLSTSSRTNSPSFQLSRRTLTLQTHTILPPWSPHLPCSSCILLPFSLQKTTLPTSCILLQHHKLEPPAPPLPPAFSSQASSPSALFCPSFDLTLNSRGQAAWPRFLSSVPKSRDSGWSGMALWRLWDAAHWDAPWGAPILDPSIHVCLHGPIQSLLMMVKCSDRGCEPCRAKPRGSGAGRGNHPSA